jgi:hypothetical protein
MTRETEPRQLDPAFTDVVAELQHRIDTLPDGLTVRRAFLETYRRTTLAVGTAVADGRFEDAAWVATWDRAFVGFFLRAHDADLSGAGVPRPWRLAFGAPASLPLLVHLLLQLNGHINYDLPQAMLAVISEEDFADPVLLESRRRDHERIDTVLAAQVSVEDHQLGLSRRFRDWVLTPVNRRSSQRFLREARRSVWHNVAELDADRRIGPEAYRDRLGELDVLASAKIADLLRPGQVLLRLAVVGFGVRLPPR